MAVLEILKYPEKSLSQPSVKVETIDEEIREFVRDMGETMFHDSGVGLAAPQVGVNKRIIVYDSHAQDPEKEDSVREVTALINPEIIASSGSFTSENEGCLSVPDYRADVKRYERVTVRALNLEGKKLEFDADGIMSVIMQHEIDHLDGILFIDRISSLKRNMYKKRILKQMKKDEQD
ncbi:peptide deformylase [Desulfospira joergensenii]|uniref:peptide deformylase n=1 Tax=Desulfospira joergensenii TaxID=53329 RepID=UPI0003B71905|nr:peptide deformylase [Desulfospira joergensenii]